MKTFKRETFFLVRARYPLFLPRVAFMLMIRKFGAVALLILMFAACSDAQAHTRTGDFITTFATYPLVPERRDAHISYDLDPANERFFIHIPANYAGDEPYGLIVFTDADETVTQVPSGWAGILDSRHFLFVAAENSGNEQDTNRRLGLAVLGALEMMKRYRVDSARVYAAGFSGGARMSGLLGFYQPEIFRGTIQNCGADFYKRVRTVYASSWLSSTGQPYGVFDGDAQEIARARQVRFALITGSNDFRRGNILDIYHGGFSREQFQAKLFDVPGMGHDTCDGATLAAALDFLAGAR
jgi:hypothetical protein